MLKAINNDKRRRSFEMVIGLIEGYKGSKQHTMEEAEKIIKGWLTSQLDSEKTYLPGRLDYNTMLYSHHGGAIVEPVAVYKGEVSPLYNSRLSDAKVIAALTDLATLLADQLKQTRIYLTYRDTILVLEDSARKSNH